MKEGVLFFSFSFSQGLSDWLFTRKAAHMKKPKMVPKAADSHSSNSQTAVDINKPTLLLRM